MSRLPIENILVQPIESLLHPAQGQGQIHPQVAGAMELAAVLNGNTHIVAGGQYIIDGLAVAFAPAGAVQEQHVGALGTADSDTLKMLCNVFAGVVHVAGDDGPQLVHPFVALVLIAADEGIHAQHIHGIVVAERGFLFHPVPEPGIVDDGVAAHQTCQVEGLAGGVHGYGAQLGILTDGLGGDVLVADADQVGPDLVGDDVDIVLFVDLHGLLDLPAFPDTAAGIMGGAENGGVDLVVHDLLLHIGEVHPPDAFLVDIEGGVDDVVAVVFQSVGEANVGGGVEQHIIAPGAEHVQSADHTAQDTVGIADVLGLQAFHTVAELVPADDGIVVFLPGGEVAIGRMLGPLDDGFGNGGHRGEVHVGHPHGDQVEALLGSGDGKSGGTGGIHGNGIHAMTVHDGSEIVFHSESPFVYIVGFIIASKVSICNKFRFIGEFIALARERPWLPPGGSCHQKRLFGTVFGD